MKAWWLAGAAAMVLTGCAGMNDEGAPSATASGSPAAATAAGNGAPAAATAAASAPASTGAYVREAALSDMYEIQAGQLAADRAAAANVKSFGQLMVTDHTATTNALKAALASANVPATPPTSLDPRRADMLRQLQGASGPAFDRLYLQQQMTAHQEALTLHSSYAQGGENPPLRTLAGQVAGKVQQHIDMLRQITPA